MITWPIGLSTGCFYRQSLFDCLELIRESGFSMIEVCFSPTHLDYHDLTAVQAAARRIEDLGMEAYSFHAPFAPHLDIASLDRTCRERALEEILRAAEAAAMLGVHYFVLHPGPEDSAIPPHEERLQRMENAVGILNRVANRCVELGICCALENKLPHLLFGKTSDILWILDALDASEVGACLDTGHAFLSGDIHHLVRKLAGHIKMVHAHDNHGHGDEHLPPGGGSIEWEPLLRELAHAGFHGAFILELAGATDPRVTLANARHGRAFLRKLCRRLALGGM
jgi:sugar phosphate isomerase/epimerase